MVGRVVIFQTLPSFPGVQVKLELVSFGVILSSEPLHPQNENMGTSRVRNSNAPIPLQPVLGHSGTQEMAPVRGPGAGKNWRSRQQREGNKREGIVLLLMSFSTKVQIAESFRVLSSWGIKKTLVRGENCSSLFYIKLRPAVRKSEKFSGN